MRLSFSSIGLVLMVAAGSLRAAAVTVNNPSFESPALGCFASNECFARSVTDWVGIGNYDIFKPGPASINSVPDGVQIMALGFSTNGEVDQDTGTFVLPNTTYTLSVEIGRRREFAMSDYSIGLIGLKTQSDTVSPTAGDFLLDTLVYTSGGVGDPNIGKAIIIQLAATLVPDSEHQTDFDSVSLDATSLVTGSAPEPSAFVLAGLGLLPLGYLRRRRR